MKEFLDLVLASGPEGLIAGLGVLVAVFLLAQGQVVVTGSQKRAANVVLSIVLSGLSLLDPLAHDGIEAAIASVASALVYEFLRGGIARIQAQAKK